MSRAVFKIGKEAFGERAVASAAMAINNGNRS